jgi:hypothetical protein
MQKRSSSYPLPHPRSCCSDPLVVDVTEQIDGSGRPPPSYSRRTTGHLSAGQWGAARTGGLGLLLCMPRVTVVVYPDQAHVRHDGVGRPPVQVPAAGGVLPRTYAGGGHRHGAGASFVENRPGRTMRDRRTEWSLVRLPVVVLGVARGRMRHEPVRTCLTESMFRWVRFRLGALCAKTFFFVSKTKSMFSEMDLL